MTARLTFDIAAQDATGKAFSQIEASARSLQGVLTNTRFDVDRQLNLVAAERRFRDLGAAGRAAMQEIAASQRVVMMGGRAPADHVGTAVRQARVDTANLTAQLNDIGVSLASGMNPFTVMLQQGAQISQAFGPGTGVRGVLAGLGTALSSMINPVNGLLLGIGAVAAGAIYYFSNSKSAAERLDETLERHREIIGSIKDRYGEAAAGLQAYARQSESVLKALAGADIARLKEQLQSLAPAIADSLGVFTARGSLRDVVQTQFRPFETAILSFVTSLRDGAPDVVRFRDQVAALMNANADSQAIQDAGRKILEMTEKAGQVGGALSSAQAAMKAFGAEAVASAGNLSSFNTALDTMNGIAAKIRPIDTLNKALGQAMDASFATGDEAMMRNAVAAYNAGLQRIGAAEAELAAKRAARAAAAPRQEDEHERALDASRKRTEQLRIEASMTGKSAADKAYETTLLDLNTAAMEANQRAKMGDHVLTTKQIALNQAEAASRREATAALERSNQAHTDLVARADEFRSAMSSSLSSMVTTYRTTGSLSQAAVAGLDRLTQAAIDAAIQMMVLSAFGRTGTPLGGGLGGIFSLFFGGGGTGNVAANVLHTGGVAGQAREVRAVAPSVFAGAPRYHRGTMAAGGIRPGEIPAILRPGEVVDPGDGSVAARVFGRGGRGGISIVNHNDFTGVDAAVVARIQAQQDAQRRQIEAIAKAPAARKRGLS
jgi:hypothetical protein